MPILVVAIDYIDRVITFGPLFQTTGDLEADLVQLKAFYIGKRGKRPELF